MIKDAIVSRAINAVSARLAGQVTICLFLSFGVKEWTTVALPTFVKRKGDAIGSTFGCKIAVEEST